MSGLDTILSRLDADIRAENDWGDVAAYIPELAGVDPAQFGIAVATANGQCHVAGDWDTGFSVQSITKIFTLAVALGRSGDQLWHRVQVGPYGDARELNRAQDLMITQGIEPLTIRLQN